MKVLYVTGACLLRNTSANMSHNAYVQGLIENGAKLDIIMASDSWGESDSKFRKYPEAEYHIFNSTSFADKIRSKGRGMINPSGDIPSALKKEDANTTSSAGRRSFKRHIRRFAKSIFFSVFRPDPIYPLQKAWLKNAACFKSSVEYDLVVSNSSPAASHRLVADLIDKKRIYAKRWVQIWEDPWYYDLYGGNSEDILKEESYLLEKAHEVFYVSPLTLYYQKKYFPAYAEKMRAIPLPAFSIGTVDTLQPTSDISFGYFGDYYSHVRNLRPFYEALLSSGFRGNIYGDSDLSLPSTDKIVTSERVTLDILEKVQDGTDVLVHLSNLRGGQIPGKIYHYSVTSKPILFILDGTEEEKGVLIDYFKKFNRYYFCNNSSEDILDAMRKIADNIGASYLPVESFSPGNVVKQFL